MKYDNVPILVRSPLPVGFSDELLIAPHETLAEALRDRVIDGLSHELYVTIGGETRTLGEWLDEEDDES